MSSALTYLQELIAQGREYPDAHTSTVLHFGCDGDELAAEYDNACASVMAFDDETATVELPSGLCVDLTYSFEWHTEFDYYSHGNVSWPDVDYTVTCVTHEGGLYLGKLQTGDYRQITKLLCAEIERQARKKHEDY